MPAEIARRARVANPRAVVVVDGAQAAGLYPLPLGDGLIDTLIFSSHKSLYGPYGVAGLVLASDWRPAPILFGGTGTFSESVAMPADLPSAYEVGSPNIWAVAGLKAALEWLRVGRIANPTCTTLPGVTVYAPPQDTGAAWCGILAFTVEGIPPQALEAALGARDRRPRRPALRPVGPPLAGDAGGRRRGAGERGVVQPRRANGRAGDSAGIENLVQGGHRWIPTW